MVTVLPARIRCTTTATTIHSERSVCVYHIEKHGQDLFFRYCLAFCAGEVHRRLTLGTLSTANIFHCVPSIREIAQRTGNALAAVTYSDATIDHIVLAERLGH